MHKNAAILGIGAILIALGLFMLQVTTVNALATFSRSQNRAFQDNTPPVAQDLNIITNEDNPVNFNLSATDVDANTLTYAIVTNPTNGNVSGGTLAARTYTPSANFNGLDSFTYRANDGLADSNTATVTITVNPVNDPPSFTKGGDQTVLEDAGPQSVSGWATAISAGPANEAGQTLTFLVSNDNNPLFSTQPAVAGNGTLTYTPAPNAFGSATVTVTLQDSGGTTNGGMNTSGPQTFTITVTPVNDPPSFTKGANQTVLEDAGPQTVNGWATGMSAGPANEADQTLSFILTNNNNSLFSTQPAVAANGTLTYTPAANAFGSATVTVTLQDSGGTANGGINTSPQTFTITLTPVNDPPSFTKGANQTVNEDSGTRTVPNWATNISPGPNESGQALTFTVTNNNNSLFTAAGRPAITSSGTLTFTPASNANGSATVTVVLKDNGGTANGGQDTSPAQTFTITVTPVNDPPALDLNGSAPNTGFNSTYVFGGDGVNITSPNLTITDIDSSDMVTATVSITNRKQGAKERLTATTNGSGITANFNADNGVLTLTGPASITNFQTVLRTVRYRIEPDATNLDTAQRSINFWVNDGQSNSNVAEAKVTILNPAIQLTVEPENQTVFKGETAFFKINVKNNGNVDLSNVVVQSAAVPTCNKTFSQLKANQNQGEEILCFVSNVSQPIDNVITATADNIQGVAVSATVTARVRLPADIVVNVAPNPLVGNTIIRGQSAVFDITLRNPLQNSSIKNVKVESFIDAGGTETELRAPDDPVPAPEECSPDIGELTPGQQIVFSCTIPNVQSSFLIRVDASGLIENIGLTQNSDSSSITMIGMTLDATVTPTRIEEGQATPVVYNLQIANNGDLPVTLDSLQSAAHGNLFNAGNNAVKDNSCPSIEKLVAPGENRSCSYSVTLNPAAGDFTIPNPVTIQGTSGGVNIVVEDNAIVRVGDEHPVALDLTASPDTLVAPGGNVTLTVVITNKSDAALTLTALTDTTLGDLNGVGDCQTPKTIPVGEEYVCAYSITVSGKQPGDQVNFKVTATTSVGQIDDSTTVPVVEIPPTRYLMPLVTNGAVAGEPHNSPCRAMPILTDLAHYFLPDDPNDWYRFTLPASRRVVVRLSSYVADGQIVIFSGDCSAPTYIQNNGNNNTEKVVDIGVRPATGSQGQPINYYIWIVTDGKFTTFTPYTLQVITSAP